MKLKDKFKPPAIILVATSFTSNTLAAQNQTIAKPNACKAKVIRLINKTPPILNSSIIFGSVIFYKMGI